MSTPFIQINDPMSSRVKSENRLNKYFASLLNDSRNLPFIYFSFFVVLTTVTFAIILYIPGTFRWWLAVPYFLFNVIFLMGPFILIQHNVAHKPLFKRKYRLLNLVIPWFLGPFFGLTPETYFAHHIGMHHPENNLSHDLSTTMNHQRDSIKDFARYFLRFFFCGIPNLFFYLKSKNRKKLSLRMSIGEGSYILLVLVLMIVNWKATIVVFIIPLIFTRFMMMAGNWAQHAFIDPVSPENCYRNSITCINSRYNKTCWNDGYHIGHHLYPWLHWTEMPGEFLKNFEKYKSEEAIVFRKLDYFMIWFYLMTKNYNTLAKYYVQLDQNKPKRRSEIIALLKSRTKSIH